MIIDFLLFLSLLTETGGLKIDAQEPVGDPFNDSWTNGSIWIQEYKSIQTLAYQGLPEQIISTWEISKGSLQRSSRPCGAREGTGVDFIKTYTSFYTISSVLNINSYLTLIIPQVDQFFACNQVI